MPLRTPVVRHPFNISQIDFSMEPLFQVAPSNILQSWFSLGHFRDPPLPPGFFQLPPGSLLCNQSSPGYQVIFLVGNLTCFTLTKNLPWLHTIYRAKYELFSLTFKIHPHATLNDNLRLLLSSIYPLDPWPIHPMCQSFTSVYFEITLDSSRSCNENIQPFLNDTHCFLPWVTIHGHLSLRTIFMSDSSLCFAQNPALSTDQ